MPTGSLPRGALLPPDNAKCADSATSTIVVAARHIKMIWRRRNRPSRLFVCFLFLVNYSVWRSAPSLSPTASAGVAAPAASHGERLLMIHWLVSPTARHAALSRAQCTASLADHSKVYTSTVALVPPEGAWLPIQQARESLRDKGLYRWPPHINLLYPFVPEEHFAQAADALAPAAAATPPFELTLDTFGVFGGRHRGVLYVCPGAREQLAALCDLQAALQAAIPHCDDQQRHGALIHPQPQPPASA